MKINTIYAVYTKATSLYTKKRVWDVIYLAGVII